MHRLHQFTYDFREFICLKAMTEHASPHNLDSHFTAPDGRVVRIRPIRPEDAEIEQRFVRNLSAESRYLRFMDCMRELTPDLLNRLTHVDFSRDMALIAVIDGAQGETEIGVARYAGDPARGTCEFAIVVADEWQGSGLGRCLMQRLIDLARQRGYKTMTGEFLADNRHMHHFVQHFGFRLHGHPQDAGIKLGVLDLQS